MNYYYNIKYIMHFLIYIKNNIMYLLKIIYNISLYYHNIYVISNIYNFIIKKLIKAKYFKIKFNIITAFLL